jgi:hypothetical protein
LSVDTVGIAASGAIYAGNARVGGTAACSSNTIVRTDAPDTEATRAFAQDSDTRDGIALDSTTGADVALNSDVSATEVILFDKKAAATIITEAAVWHGKRTLASRAISPDTEMIDMETTWKAFM